MGVSAPVYTVWLSSLSYATSPTLPIIWKWATLLFLKMNDIWGSKMYLSQSMFFSLWRLVTICSEGYGIKSFFFGNVDSKSREFSKTQVLREGEQTNEQT